VRVMSAVMADVVSGYGLGLTRKREDQSMKAQSRIHRTSRVNFEGAKGWTLVGSRYAAVWGRCFALASTVSCWAGQLGQGRRRQGRARVGPQRSGPLRVRDVWPPALRLLPLAMHAVVVDLIDDLVEEGPADPNPDDDGAAGGNGAP